MGTKVFGEPNGDRIPGQLEVGMGCGVGQGGPSSPTTEFWVRSIFRWDLHRTL